MAEEETVGMALDTKGTTKTKKATAKKTTKLAPKKELDKLALWNKVEKTDPKHTKRANVKGNNLTSIKPQYQVYKATEQWGSYGSTWGFKFIQLGYELSAVGLVTFEAIFFYPGGEFPIINTISIYRDNARTKLDDEFAKKVETDALTKCLSKLGFNADIFMGRFDDARYVAEVTKEFAAPVAEQKVQKPAVQNKPTIEELNPQHKFWDACKKGLAEGKTDLDNLKKKYKISEANIKLLTSK